MSLTFTVRASLRHFGGVKQCFFNHYVRRSLASKPNEKKLYNWNSVAAGIAIGAIAGAAYTYYQSSESEFDEVRTLKTPLKISSFPKVEISRKIAVPNDALDLNVTLFQYPTCPFCCKVRAFLDFYGISYNVVEVNPVLRQQIKWSQYKKVPILLIKSGHDYLQFNDSSFIISALATFLRDRHVNLEHIQEYYPITQDVNNPKKTEVMNKYFVMDGQTTEKALKHDRDEREWRMWADNVLVHVLSPNVYRTKDEALQSFYWFSEVGEWERLFSTFERLLVIYVGAFVMWIIAKKLQKKHNLKEDVRQSLYDECNNWMKQIEARGSPFFGGEHPNLADLAVYGVLNSIEGCSAFRDLLTNTNIGTWYFKMKEATKNHEGQKLLM